MIFVYEAGTHLITVADGPTMVRSRARRPRGDLSPSHQVGRWTVKVNQVPVAGEFPTASDAWAAGVAEADRLGAPLASRASRAAPAIVGAPQSDV